MFNIQRKNDHVFHISMTSHNTLLDVIMCVSCPAFEPEMIDRDFKDLTDDERKILSIYRGQTCPKFLHDWDIYGRVMALSPDKVPAMIKALMRKYLMQLLELLDDVPDCDDFVLSCRGAIVSYMHNTMLSDPCLIIRKSRDIMYMVAMQYPEVYDPVNISCVIALEFCYIDELFC